MLVKKLKILFLILILPILSSCFQIVEEINLAKSGSGRVNLTLNMSASKSKVASIMLMDSIQGYKVPNRQTIQKEMNEAVEYLRNSPGISNVEKKIDFENYIVSLSFDFKSITNINNLTSNVLKRMKVNAMNNSSYSYDPRTLTFKRSYVHTKEAINQYNKLKREVKNIFNEATYTSIYRFEGVINHSNNPLAKVSKSKKAVMINAGMLGLINGKTDISNKIVLAK